MEPTWNQEALFIDRLSKSAAALAAVASTLERHPSLTDCQSEFLEFYSFPESGLARRVHDVSRGSKMVIE